MLTVLGNWLYIAITAFGLGVGFCAFSGKILGYRLRSVRTVIFAGLLLAGVYAQAVSLFGRVNIEANLGLILGALVLLFLFRATAGDLLRDALQKATALRWGMALLLLLAWAFFTSRGYCVWDMNLYHGQSIRWIEEYGAVRGQGLINGRFAYNSSIFALSALYDFYFWLGHSVHAVNGFLALLMSFEALELCACFQRRKMLISDYARVALVYYLTLIWDEITAPSSDYAVMLTVFFVVIRWLACCEEQREGEKNVAPFALLCVVIVFAMSLKLSAGLIILLLIKPALWLLREKRVKEIVIYLSMGLLTALPWMARTVIISGWLFYPFTALDLFDPVWKMRNKEVIDMDAKVIAAWARGTRNLGVDIPVRIWFLPWLKNELRSFERIIVMGDIAACLYAFVRSLVSVIKKRWERLDEGLVLLTLTACYLFWQLSAPMLRYGYAYVLLLPAVCGGSFLTAVFRGRQKWLRAAYVAILLFGCYRLWAGLTYVRSELAAPYYVYQVDYEAVEGEEYLVGNLKFYVIPDGELPGFYLCPVYSARPGEVEALGDRMRDGFRPAGNE